MSEFEAVENMIDDDEGMNNALDYYTNGGNESYWQWFIKLGKEDDEEEEERQSYWGDWTDEDHYTNEVSNVDSAEEMEEEYDYWDEYDYDDDYDWDKDWVVD